MKLKFKSRFTILIFLSGAILLFPFISHAQTPINCGQVISESISAAGEKDYYTFTASAGDVVTIRLRKVTSFTTATYYMGAIVDYGNAVTELNEGNNALAGNLITLSP